MPDPLQDINELLCRDRRYKVEAYAFVFDALTYAHKALGMGKVRQTEESAEAGESREAEERAAGERHLTGQQLCEAIRLYALDQYGYMAKCVFNSWGVHNTGDFGEIVFNLIRIGQMKKTKDDRREDFDDVFDFDEGLTQSFRIERS